MIRKPVKALLDRLYQRHQDKMLLRDPDLQESIRQMRAGETRPAQILEEESEEK